MSQISQVSTQMNNKTEYVTTAIVYPNARIHVGWAWECLGADWLVRGLRAFGKDTFFATGMDEHSINVQRAAEAKGLTPKAYCDQMAVDIEKVLKQMGMQYDRFIRTSDPDHERVVKALVQRAFDKGDIYSARYEGLYCDSCEAYYTDKEVVKQGGDKGDVCPVHQKPVRQVSEENYFFRLSKYQDRLVELFKANPQFLQPEYRKAEVLNFIQSGLKDFSVSRSTFQWGIPLPFDPKQIVYVWFDALINYLTAAGLEFKLNDPDSEGARQFDARWPARVHIIGKDISRFHCVYWPAMLMSLDLPLPRQVFAHGYINIKGDRMSKSSGNIVTPDEVMAITGPDPFRYYLLAENQFSQDGNFSWEALVLRNNADLANDWGNLVNRSISMTRKYFADQTIRVPEKFTHSLDVKASFEKLPAELEFSLEEVESSSYAAACTARSRILNLYIDRMKPWILAKNTTPEAQESLQEVMFTLLEGIRWLACAWMPVLPFGMPDVFRQLGIPAPEEKGAITELQWGAVEFRPEVPKPIYPRLESKVEAKVED